MQLHRRDPRRPDYSPGLRIPGRSRTKNDGGASATFGISGQFVWASTSGKLRKLNVSTADPVGKVRTPDEAPDMLDQWSERLAGLRRIGVDEFSYRKRHHYLTLVVDHDKRRVVWAGKGRSAARSAVTNTICSQPDGPSRSKNFSPADDFRDDRGDAEPARPCAALEAGRWRSFDPPVKVRDGASRRPAGRRQPNLAPRRPASPESGRDPACGRRRGRGGARGPLRDRCWALRESRRSSRSASGSSSRALGMPHTTTESASARSSRLRSPSSVSRSRSLDRHCIASPATRGWSRRCSALRRTDDRTVYSGSRAGGDALGDVPLREAARVSRRTARSAEPCRTPYRSCHRRLAAAATH